MIRLFETTRRILFFPKRWANAVTRWITGIHSPSGTIQIRNTTSPDENGSMTLDVNVEALAKKLRRALQVSLSKGQRSDVRDVIRTCLDDVSVYWRDGAVSVNQDWLTNIIEGVVGGMDLGGGSTEPPPNTSFIPSGYVPTTNPGSKDTTSFTAGEAGGSGVVLNVLCRAATNGADCVLHFRKLTITSDGRIQHVSAETDAVAVFEAT